MIKCNYDLSKTFTHRVHIAKTTHKQTYLQSRISSKISRRIMKTTVIPKAPYGCESWDLTNLENRKTLQNMKFLAETSYIHEELGKIPKR